MYALSTILLHKNQQRRAPLSILNFPNEQEKTKPFWRLLTPLNSDQMLQKPNFQKGSFIFSMVLPGLQIFDFQMEKMTSFISFYERFGSSKIPYEKIQKKNDTYNKKIAFKTK